MRTGWIVDERSRPTSRSERVPSRARTPRRQHAARMQLTERARRSSSSSLGRRWPHRRLHGRAQARSGGARRPGTRAAPGGAAPRSRRPPCRQDDHRDPVAGRRRRRPGQQQQDDRRRARRRPSPARAGTARATAQRDRHGPGPAIQAPSRPTTPTARSVVFARPSSRWRSTRPVRRRPEGLVGHQAVDQLVARTRRTKMSSKTGHDDPDGAGAYGPPATRRDPDGGGEDQHHEDHDEVRDRAQGVHAVCAARADRSAAARSCRHRAGAFPRGDPRARPGPTTCWTIGRRSIATSPLSVRTTGPCSRSGDELLDRRPCSRRATPDGRAASRAGAA